MITFEWTQPKTNLNHPLNHTLSRSEMTPTKIQDLQESPKRFPNNQQLYEVSNQTAMCTDLVTYDPTKQTGIENRTVSTRKKVVFNGTFPIDEPISRKHKSKRHSNEIVPREERSSNRSWSIQELIRDESIKINYGRMRMDYEKSFTEFERFLEKKNFQEKFFKSFDVD